MVGGQEASIVKISLPAWEILHVASGMAGAIPGCRLGRSWQEQGLAPELGVRRASRQVTKTGTEAAAQGSLTGDKLGTTLGNKAKDLLSDGGQRRY